MSTTGMLISDVRPLDRNTLKASFTVTLPSGMVVHECTLHIKGDSRWVGLPARSYERNGERKWVPIIEFTDRATADRFRDAVLAAIERPV